MRHLMVVLATLTAASVLCSPALGCSFAPTPVHVVDPALADSDTEPPDSIEVLAIEIQRGAGPQEEPGCAGTGFSSTSCDDIGSITLRITPPGDDQSPPEDIGYRVEVAGGSPPAGLSIGVAEGNGDLSAGQAVTIQATDFMGPVIFMLWGDGATDQQEPFSFALSVTAVDKAGNPGESTVVEIVHAGSQDTGCATISGRTTGSALTFLGLLMLISFARRRL